MTTTVPEPAPERCRLVLWDVDGTLLHGGTVGLDAFEQAVTDVVGRRPSIRPQLGGRTDLDIVAQFLSHLEVPEEPETVARILALLDEHVAARAHAIAGSGFALAGAPELLERLAGDPRVMNSLLTGNTAANARVKLAAFGLDGFVDFEVGAYGTDHVNRNALVPIALRRVAEHRGLVMDPSDVWVIGDTPADLACARAGHARCLLVATGQFNLGELAALSPDAVFEDLSDVEAVIAVVTG